jgi:hypothetical protein
LLIAGWGLEPIKTGFDILRCTKYGTAIAVQSREKILQSLPVNPLSYCSCEFKVIIVSHPLD